MIPHLVYFRQKLAHGYSRPDIKVRVMFKVKPYCRFYWAYNDEFRPIGQPWRDTRVLRISSRSADILALSPISSLRWMLEASVLLSQVSECDTYSNIS